MATETYELRADGAERPWITNLPTPGAAWSALDGYAPRDLKLKVRRCSDGAEVPRVDYVRGEGT